MHKMYIYVGVRVRRNLLESTVGTKVEQKLYSSTYVQLYTKPRNTCYKEMTELFNFNVFNRNLTNGKHGKSFLK